ncbi:MAG: maleate cis-trans isomerase family protein [Sulfitobacter sp.]
MSAYGYRTAPEEGPGLGLIVLQADERIEADFRAMLPAAQPLLVSRVPSGDAVTPATLQAMAGHLTAAAALFPKGKRFAALGYGCTSGAAQIGAAAVADLMRAGAPAAQVSNPLSALIAACGALNIDRIALLSPYVAQVSERLRDALREAGIETPVFGSFNESEEAKVAQIDSGSVLEAACDLASNDSGAAPVQAIFLSCTNLRSLPVIAQIEARTGLVCLSSNQVLAWHMAQLAGVQAVIPGALGQCA